MAYHVRIMPRAERDLWIIYESIGARSSDAAFKWYAGLRDAIRTLSNTPNRRPTTPEDANLRHLLYGRKPHIYRGIYRVLEESMQVHILHIRHGARQEFKTKEIT